MHDLTITVRTARLSDGSEVSEVALWANDGPRQAMALVIPAVTDRDALALLDEIKASIEAHSNETVRVI